MDLYGQSMKPSGRDDSKQAAETSATRESSTRGQPAAPLGSPVSRTGSDSAKSLLLAIDSELLGHTDPIEKSTFSRQRDLIAPPSDDEALDETAAPPDRSIDGSLLCLVIPLLTSSMRHVSSARLRLMSIACLARFACVDGLDHAFLVNSVVPYFVEAARDESAMVRAHAIAAVSCVLSRLHATEAKDTYVVPHYVIEGLSICADDPSAIVREAYATARPVLLLAARAMSESFVPVASAIGSDGDAAGMSESSNGTLALDV